MTSIYFSVHFVAPIPVAARSKGLPSLAFWDCRFEFRLSHSSVVCCHVKVSATDRSLVQMRSTECGVSEYDRGNL